MKDGFSNVVPVLDNMDEFEAYQNFEKDLNIGVRIAAEEEPKYQFYTSRLGIRQRDVIHFT